MSYEENMNILAYKIFYLSNVDLSYRICFGEAEHYKDLYSHLFGWESGTYHFCYWGLSMIYRKLNLRSGNKWKKELKKRLSGWKGKHLLTGVRLVFLNSVLSSLPMFMLSFLRYLGVS